MNAICQLLTAQQDTTLRVSGCRPTLFKMGLAMLVHHLVAFLVKGPTFVLILPSLVSRIT